MTPEQARELRGLRDAINDALKYVDRFIYHDYEMPVVEGLCEAMEDAVKFLKGIEPRRQKRDPAWFQNVRAEKVVDIMKGGELWERGYIVALIDINDITYVIVRVSGYVDKAYRLNDFYAGREGLEVEMQ